MNNNSNNSDNNQTTGSSSNYSNSNSSNNKETEGQEEDRNKNTLEKSQKAEASSTSSSTLDDAAIIHTILRPRKRVANFRWALEAFQKLRVQFLKSKRTQYWKQQGIPPRARGLTTLKAKRQIYVGFQNQNKEQDVRDFMRKWNYTEEELTKLVRVSGHSRCRFDDPVLIQRFNGFCETLPVVCKPLAKTSQGESREHEMMRRRGDIS